VKGERRNSAGMEDGDAGIGVNEAGEPEEARVEDELEGGDKEDIKEGNT
jgi:hypothetical protein